MIEICFGIILFFCLKSLLNNNKSVELDGKLTINKDGSYKYTPPKGVKIYHNECNKNNHSFPIIMTRNFASKPDPECPCECGEIKYKDLVRKEINYLNYILERKKERFNG